MKTCKKITKTKTTKLFHNQWPTMEREFRWNRNKSNICPLCNLHPETKHHILQCTSTTTNEPRKISTDTIIKTLKAQNTHPLIIRHIKRILFQFQHNFNIPPAIIHQNVTPIDQRTLLSINEMIKNGMDVFFNGLIPQSLMECQHAYATANLDKIPDKHIWSQNLIRLLHTHALTLWKSRSKFIHEHTGRTHEQHIRNEAYHLMVSLQRDPSVLPASLRHLTKTSRHYFFKTRLRNINAWTDRVQTAITKKNVLIKLEHVTFSNATV